MRSRDPYLDPSGGVLRNRLSITDCTELDRAEATLSTLRLIELRQAPLRGSYDLDHLRAFHRYIFGDLYDWAGDVRTISISKGLPFCMPGHIAGFAAEVFGRLAERRHLRGLDHPDFVASLAALLGEVNSLHPFREGNGRTQRAFVTQLARDAGYALHWIRMDPAENITASRAAHHGDNEPLHRLLEGLVSPFHSPAEARAPDE